MIICHGIPWYRNVVDNHCPFSIEGWWLFFYPLSYLTLTLKSRKIKLRNGWNTLRVCWWRQALNQQFTCWPRQNTKIAIKQVDILSISVTTKESAGTLGGYYALADISKNAIAQSAKIIIPLGGCRADNIGGYAAVASPYLSTGAGLACKLWAVNSASADTYLMSFVCLSWQTRIW